MSDIIDDLKQLRSSSGMHFDFVDSKKRYLKTIFGAVAEIEKLREALADMLAQHGCKCGHPACKACERTRDYEKMIDKAGNHAPSSQATNPHDR